MASIPLSLSAEKHEHLRPVNLLDLPQVADLIELCFADTMDADGQWYVEDMRRRSQRRGFLHWMRRAAESTSLPLTGFVWEENGRMVGNVSLVPFRQKQGTIFMIANVATHPDYRRRGIARALMQRAMNLARQRRARAIWLHVRADNPAAIALYRELGFEERARRTTWRARGGVPAFSLPPQYWIEPLTPRLFKGRGEGNWAEQQAWWRRVYPDELAWYRHWNFSLLQPGLWNWFYLFFVEVYALQWGAFRVGAAGKRLEAVLAWLSFGRGGESLWAAPAPGSSPEALTGLLIQARRVLSPHLTLWLDYPAGEGVEAIEAAGFSPQRTLLWMRADGATK